MLKKMLTIIGLMLTTLTVSAPEAYAQNCNPLSADTYECEEQDLHNYCAIKYGAQGASRSLYRSSYCGNALDITDDTIPIISEQLELSQRLVENILSGRFDATEIPEEFLSTYANTEGKCNDDCHLRVFNVVKTAFDNERALMQMKEAMKPRLEAKEIWMDGSLLNSPFDIIVDLNLIDVVLFGSGSHWVDNVYAWPDSSGSGDEAGGDDTDSADGDGTSDGDAGSGSGAGSLPDVNLYDPNQIDLNSLECLPPGHPDAALPGAGEKPPNCGDGVLDSGESCDDGNPLSGDGCSAECVVEPGGHDNSNKTGAAICFDPNAITFTQYGDDEDDDGLSGKDAIYAACPAGLYPSVTAFASALSTGLSIPGEITQPEDYPGPNVGGVFRNYPNVNKPNCPAGTNELLTADAFGNSVNLGNNAPRCIPTQACASFDAVRNILRSTGAPESSVASIESFVCVDIKTENRPETPYQAIEGCVDCHFAAMTDVVDRMLGKAVTPLENTTQAFGISSRFGPQFSFDLNTRFKAIFRRDKKTTPSDVENTKQALRKLEQDRAGRADPDSEVSDPKIVPKVDDPTESAGERVSRFENYVEEKQNQYEDEFKVYVRSTSEAVADQEFDGRIRPLLNQMLSSFRRIHTNISSISVSTNLTEKPACSTLCK